MKKYTIIATVLLAVVLTIGIAAVILEKVNSDTLQTERPEVTSTGGIPSPTPDSTEICTPSTSTENAVTTTPTAEITSTVIPTHTGILIGATRYPTMAPTTAPTAKPTEAPPKDLENIDFSKKRAVQITSADYKKYDYIIGMDSYNLRNMKRIFGEDKDNKLSLLLDYTDEPRDVADPWYTGDFSGVFDDIEKSLSGLLEVL